LRSFAEWYVGVHGEREAASGEKEFAAARTGRGRAGALALGISATSASGWPPHNESALAGGDGSAVKMAGHGCALKRLGAKDNTP